MTRHENDHLEGHGMLWKTSGEAFNIVECSDVDLSRATKSTHFRSRERCCPIQAANEALLLKWEVFGDAKN